LGLNSKHWCRCPGAQPQVSGAQMSGAQVPRCQVPRCPGVMTPTKGTWRHLARCHFPFWSHLKSPKKITKKNLKNQDTLLHHDPIKKIRVHPPGCLIKGGTWQNAIALLTVISIGKMMNILGVTYLASFCCPSYSSPKDHWP